MAVQKSKKSRARRGSRRSHHALDKPTLGLEPHSGESHLRHNLSPDGFYRGEQLVQRRQKKQKEEAEAE